MRALSSLEIKIISFLRQVGVEVDPAETSSIQLVRYFEEEFGCSVLALLEKEYWEEQVELDFGDGFFERVRDRLDDEQWRAFDGIVSEARRRRDESADEADDNDEPS